MGLDSERSCRTQWDASLLQRAITLPFSIFSILLYTLIGVFFIFNRHVIVIPIFRMMNQEAILHRPKTFEQIFEEYLTLHVTSLKRQQIGSKDPELERCAFGCSGVEVDRCVPKLVIDKLKLEPGKSVVLIGPNGSGKSTVYDTIQETGSDTGKGSAALNTGSGRGSVVYGESVHDGRKKLRISRLRQEEMLASLQDDQVEEVLERTAKFFLKEFSTNPDDIDWTQSDAQQKFDQAMKQEESARRIQKLKAEFIKLFNIDEFLDREVSELSGGERTKLSLCMLLLSEPDVLLLDEPTNHLDIESIGKLSGLLDAYLRAGVSVVSVSHVDWFLDQVGSHGVMEIESDGGNRHLKFSNAPYSRYKRDRSRQEHTVVEGKITWTKQNLAKTNGVLLSPSSQELNIQESPLSDVSVPPLLAREVWVLSGNNGCGKTKLMEAMIGQEKGKHFFNKGKGVTFAYLPQFWPDEVAQGSLENFFSWIKDSLDPHNVEMHFRRFMDQIHDIGFEHAGGGKGASHWAKKKISTFSGGEQRLLWFIAVSCFPHVDALMLDEPTNHMDQKLQGLVTKAMQDFPGAVVFSTHDLALLEEISHPVSGVGNKGSTMGVKNLILHKREGKTVIAESSESPIAYARVRLAGAVKRGQRVRV
ncbi:ABC-F family ATP-binding cassette domain-containing protein [Candidatus Uhrbacteria bacterium]|nr:ABC-F family ATP-binding cassette domain-containing protein [Candidatus Uhrbacteria bacterium]